MLAASMMTGSRRSAEGLHSFKLVIVEPEGQSRNNSQRQIEVVVDNQAKG